MARTIGVWGLVCLGAALAGCGSSSDEAPVGGGGAAGSDAGPDVVEPDGGGDGDAAALPFCTGDTTLGYDPLSQAVSAWPDDFWSVDDATTKTGLRVKIVDGDNYAMPTSAASFHKVFEDLSTLDGFGTTAELFFSFTGPLDDKTLPASGEGSGKADASLVLVNLDSPTPQFVDFELAQIPEAAGDPTTTLVVSPLAPLAPKTRYGLALTTRAKDANGGCIAPSPAMASLLGGTATDPALVRLKKRYDDLVARLVAAKTIDRAQDLTAAVVFTTQHTLEDSETIAADVRSKPVAYKPGAACVDDAGGVFKTCEGTFDAWDYRAGHHAIDDGDLSAHDLYTIPVTTYLPKTGTPPFRTVIYGHGLNGDRHQGAQLAALAAPEGYAVVAIDAVEHGDHPAKSGGFLAAMDFFGLSLSSTDALDSKKLRDNWRQSTYDKLQLVEMLRPGVDVDGDATTDVGTTDLVYLGVSLGGIMAAEFAAFAPDTKVAIPIVPGARVVNIIRDASTFAPVVSILKSSATDGEVARFFPMVQTAIDRGDSGAYVGHVAKDRLAGFDARSPQVLMQMVIADDTVPNPENRFFARGLGVPHVGDELQKIGTIPHQQALPVSGNLDATHTGGVFQYDVVCSGACPSPTKPATHGNVAANPVAIAQTLHFLSTYFSAGVAEIIDPYKTLGVK